MKTGFFFFDIALTYHLGHKGMILGDLQELLPGQIQSAVSYIRRDHDSVGLHGTTDKSGTHAFVINGFPGLEHQLLIRLSERIFDEIDDTETPIMPFISELRELKNNNPDEYNRLSSLSGTIISTVGADKKSSFSALHETDKQKELLHSFLYISNEDGSARKVSQLEFFEKLKPLSTLEGMETESELIEKYKTSVLNCYAADLQNADISMRSKLRKGATEISNAMKKLQTLYDAGLSEEYEDKLDEIANSINDKNFGIINKVLEMDFKNDGLGTIQLEADIDYLYKYTHAKAAETDTNVAIEFIVK